MPTNTLYIMTGLPYSGKSTLTRELVKRFGFRVVSVDDIMDREQMWREGHPTQNDWNYAYSEAYETIKRYLKNGESVILDCGNLPRHERETSKNIAESLGVKSKLIYLNISKEEIGSRRERNGEIKEREQLDDEQMKKAFELFDEPKPEEKPIFYNQQMGLEKWIKDNIGQ